MPTPPSLEIAGLLRGLLNHHDPLTRPWGGWAPQIPMKIPAGLYHLKVCKATPLQGLHDNVHGFPVPSLAFQPPGLVWKGICR